ncbi:MAG: SDR family NAD(P)-dependent oxidoreductase [Reichenbachiella sp.]
MKTNKEKIALVTGANSGIGYETVRQLSKRNYGTIILACRSIAKAQNTKEKLLTEGYHSSYELLAVDVSERYSTEAALSDLIKLGQPIDLLILNACMNPGSYLENQNGMELTVASSLLGHHILTQGLLRNQLLTDDAKILISGSEAARGDVPMMGLPNLEEEKNQSEVTIKEVLKAHIFNKGEKSYNPFKTYAFSKVLVTLWAKSLARELPSGMIVNTISPGGTPDTNLVRDQAWFMKKLMMPMMSVVGVKLGVMGTLAQAADRYLAIEGFDSSTSGDFWVSKKGKMTGPLTIFNSDMIDNKDYQDTVWEIMEEVTKNEAHYEEV